MVDPISALLGNSGGGGNGNGNGNGPNNPQVRSFFELFMQSRF